MSLDKYDRPIILMITPEKMEKWLRDHDFIYRGMYGLNGKIFFGTKLELPMQPNTLSLQTYEVILPVSQSLGDYVNRMYELITDLAEIYGIQSNKLLSQMVEEMSHYDKGKSESETSNILPHVASS